MKKPDLLVLVAVWQFVAAFFVLCAAGFMSLLLLPSSLGMWGNNWGSMWGMNNIPEIGAIAIVMAIFIMIVYIVVGIVGGIGLLVGKEWGRITSIVHNALSLISFPIGTTLGILSIVYLTKSEVKEYFTPRKSTV